MLHFRSLVMFLFASLIFNSCNGQQKTSPAIFTFDNFDRKILDYEPVRRSGVDEKAYRKGKFFLSETRSATKNDPKNLNAGDYWNITMAFLQLEEPREHLAIAFRKAITSGPESICSYIDHLGAGRLPEVIPEIYQEFFKKCPEFSRAQKQAAGVTASKDKVADERLRTLMEKVQQHDQRFRETEQDMVRQQPLDRQNQRIIDSLFQEHRKYIGRTLVGENLEHVMWAVIQHSNQEMMERYLPVVKDAVRSGELSNEAPLKMLIDRVYWLKHGSQIFGSQAGVDLADEAEIKRVKRAYGLE